MTSFKAIVQNRQIEIEAPHDLPDGTEVCVEVSMPVVCMGIEKGTTRLADRR